MNQLEFQINNFTNVNTDVAEIKKKVKEHDESIVSQKYSIDDSIYFIYLFLIYLVLRRIAEFDLKFTEYDQSFQDINLKLISVESLSFFKRDDNDQKGYSNDELSALVMALEKRVTQKFTYVDERFKKNEEDILKLKQMEKSIENINKNLENTNKNVDSNKENINILFAKFEDLDINFKNLNDVTNKTFKDQLDKLKQYFEEKIFE